MYAKALDRIRKMVHTNFRSSCSHSSTYETVLILGDFDVEADDHDQNMKTFCDSYSVTGLIK